jgi:hypothetical protein
MSGRHRKQTKFPWPTVGAVIAVVAVAVALAYFFLSDDGGSPLGEGSPQPTASSSTQGQENEGGGEEGGQEGGDGQGEGGSAGCPAYRSSVLEQLRQAAVHEQQVILFVEQALRGEESSAIAPVIDENLSQIEAVLTALRGLGSPPEQLQADVTSVLDVLSRFVDQGRSYEEALSGGRPVPDDAAELLTDLLDEQPKPNQIAGCAVR